MNTYRITCRETVYFVKEVKANSEDEANEKLHANVNGFKDVEVNILLSKTFSDMGEKVLLIDDLSDTGLTLNKSIEWQQQIIA